MIILTLLPILHKMQLKYEELSILPEKLLILSLVDQGAVDLKH